MTHHSAIKRELDDLKMPASVKTMFLLIAERLDDLEERLDDPMISKTKEAIQKLHQKIDDLRIS